MRSFDTLEALNAFLTEIGLPNLTEADMTATNGRSGVFTMDLSNLPNRDKAIEKLKAVMQQSAEEPQQEEVEVQELPDFLKMLLGEAMQDIEEDEVPMVEQAKLDAYIEMSCDQIALVTRQRDEARQAFDNERSEHDQCHEAFDLQLHEMRIFGHMESTAAGLFNKPWDELPGAQQVALRHQAEATIARLDSLRAAAQG